MNHWLLYNIINHQPDNHILLIPSGKHTENYGKIHHFSWVNPLDNMINHVSTINHCHQGRSALHCWPTVSEPRRVAAVLARLHRPGRASDDAMTLVRTVKKPWENHGKNVWLSPEIDVFFFFNGFIYWMNYWN